MMILVSGSTRTVASIQHAWPGMIGVLLTPANRNSVGSVVKTGLPWAIDNGSFSDFDPERFRRKVASAVGQPRLLWVVVPDVVADAKATMRRWQEWEPELRDAGVPLAFVLQDGQEDMGLPDAACYFVGGSTAWKLSESAGGLAAEAKRRGAWLHCGRVNSLRRLRTAWDMGCDSVDGSGYSRFAAVARLKGRNDMLLERHLAFVQQLEGQPTLYA